MSLKDQIAAHKAQQGTLSLKDRIASHRQQAVNTPQEPAAAPERSWGDAYDDFAMGLALSGAETIQGIGDLVGYDIDPVHRNALEMMREDYKDASSWAGGGRFAGELAQFALPAAGAGKLVKAAKLAKPAAGAALVGLDTAGSAGLGYLKAPDEGRSRLDRAKEEGISALAGHGIGGVLNKAVRGITRSAAGDKLLKEGVRLTPAQASGGGVLGRMAEAGEYVAGVTPFLAKGTQRAKEQGIRDWNKNVLRNVAPKGYQEGVTEAGQAGAKQLKDAFTTAYKDAWELAGSPSEQGIFKVLNEAQAAGSQLTADSQKAIKTSLSDVLDLYGKYTPEKMREVDNLLRKRVNTANSAANPQTELADALSGIRRNLREASSTEGQKALRSVDSKYGEYLAAQRAGTASGAMKNKGEFTPDELLAGAKGASSRSRTFTGDASLQQAAQEGLETVGKKDRNPIIDMMKGVATKADIPFSETLFDAGGRLMLGNSIPQRQAQELMSSRIAEALRETGIISPAAIAAAYSD